MNLRRVGAWWLLGRRMAVQLATLPLRSLRREGGGRDGRGARALLAAVAPEGYLPLSAEERADFPAFTRCISCGFCALACPAIREAPAAAWAEAWSFVVGSSRLLERARLAAASLEPCARCAACAAVCPTGVPIPRLAAMIERLASVPIGREQA